MSFQTNETILRVPPSVIFSPTLRKLHRADHRQAGDAGGHAGNPLHAEPVELAVPVDRIGRRRACPRRAGGLCLCAAEVSRSEDIAFTLLSFRFAPPLLVLLPLTIYFQQLGLANTYGGLIWVYQLIVLPLILWIVRGYFEDIPADIEYAYRIAGHDFWSTFRRIALPLAGPGIAAAGLLSFIFAWNNFVFALVLASADKQPVTVGALAFVTASGIQYGQVAAGIVLSIAPTFALAIYAQRYLVEGLSLGAVKG
jgi:multiple sugar transport system permease protein